MEFVFNKVSLSVLWNAISSPNGLADWFSDDVSVSGNVYTFRWEKSEQTAELLSIRHMKSIRFRWSEDRDDSYFEFLLTSTPLTGVVSLVITDFAELDEKEDLTGLWNAEIDNLRRKIGA